MNDLRIAASPKRPSFFVWRLDDNVFGEGKGKRQVGLWIANIINLIEKGEVANDDNNGYVIMDGSAPVFSEESAKTLADASAAFDAVSTICSKCQLKKPCKFCLGCMVAQYCSKDCQKADWKHHKKECASKKTPEPQYNFTA
jgi:hypothetical protein